MVVLFKHSTFLISFIEIVMTRLNSTINTFLFSFVLFSFSISAQTQDSLAVFNGVAFGMHNNDDQAQEASATVSSNQRVSELVDSLLTAIINDYANKKRISVSPELKQSFLVTFGESSSLPVQKQQALAEKFVKQWLVEKSLYGEFGGTVVYRPTNPQMPIEAYLKLLKQYEAQGDLVFTDEDFSQAFWSLFSPPYQLALEAEAVDYSSPWWAKS